MLQDLIERHCQVSQMSLAERTKTMLAAPTVEGIGQEQGVIEGADLDPVAGQYEVVVLEVLADLENRCILKEGFQEIEGLPERHLFKVGLAEVEAAAGAVAERNVAGSARCDREGEADKLRLHGVEAR